MPVPTGLDGPNGIELSGDGATEVDHVPFTSTRTSRSRGVEALRVLDGADPVVPLTLSREFLTECVGDLRGQRGRDAWEGELRD
ncbi:MAG: hypothetical protein R2838_07845 [Caldilineaceae bacterium]